MPLQQLLSTILQISGEFIFQQNSARVAGSQGSTYFLPIALPKLLTDYQNSFTARLVCRFVLKW